MILFGMPLTRGPREDASSAVRAGLAMIERLKQFNAEHASDPHYPRDLHIGVGIHSGVVVAGNVGARDRLEYSAIGEAVNLASRLESATKELGAELVMSEATWALVRDSVETVRLGDVTIRGFDGTMTVYGAAAAAAGTA
jgi:adenylate cyclase